MVVRRNFRGELYRDKDGDWRWRVVHKNGNTVADSAEGYTRQVDCKAEFKALFGRMTYRISTAK